MTESLKMSAPAAPAPAVAPSSPTVAPGPQAEISREQADTMATWIKSDVAANKMSPEQAAKAFAELGIPLDRQGPDTRTDEQRELDRHFPAAKPADYKISWAGPGGDSPVMTTEERKRRDTAARTWLSEAGTPREIGNSIVNAMAQTEQQTKGMTAEQLDRYAEAEYTKLERAYGATLDDRLREAGRMIAALEAKHPGLKDLLKSQGVGDNAMVANLLIQQAERYHARKGR